MSEKLCLKWNDFQENVYAAFGSLREDNEFADVACEDGQQIEAHKVILAASSPFFQNLLKINKHPHPLVYMRGIKFENLAAIVDFVYCGEANVFQENLDSFLAISEELKLKGLMGQTEDYDNTTERNSTDQIPQQMSPKPFVKREKSDLNKLEQRRSNLEPKLDKQVQNVFMNDKRRMSIQNFITGNLQELDEKVKSMMEISQNLIPSGRERAKICKVCGKEGKAVNIGDHIEANHLEGVSLPCNVCGKEFRTRVSLRYHRASKHQNPI